MGQSVSVEDVVVVEDAVVLGDDVLVFLFASPLAFGFGLALPLASPLALL